MLKLSTHKILALAAALAVTPAALAQATAPAQPSPATPATQPAPTTPAAVPDRSVAYYHYALAHTYEDMAAGYGLPEYGTQAIEEYKLALQADPTSKELNTGLAEMYFRLGRIRDSVMEAQELVKKDPNNLDAHKLLGRIYLRSLSDAQEGSPSDQMLKQAIEQYEKIVQLEPTDVEDHLLLGRLYSLDHDQAKAKTQFEAARKIEPSSEDAALNLARVYSEDGQMNEAVQTLLAMPEEDRTAKTETALGAVYEQQHDEKNAIAAYRRAVALDPDSLDTERALAQALLTAGQIAEAQKTYQDIAATDPQDATAYVRISEIQRNQGKYDDALATLNKAKSLVHDSVEVNYNEALIYDSLGRFDEAATLLQKLVADATHTGSPYTQPEKSNLTLFLDRLANVYREQNKTAEAVATYRQMIDLGPDAAARAYQFIIETYRDARESGKALDAAKEAVAKYPLNADLKLVLAGQLADNNQVDAAIKLSKEQLKGTPADRETYISLAQMYTRLRRYQDASDALDSAEKLTTRPEDRLFVYFLRGDNFDRQKDDSAAEVQFRKALAIDPNNAATLNYLGYMFADRGVRLDESVTLLKKAVELDPQNGAYLDSLGWAYFKQGNYQMAEDNLLKAIQRLPADPSLHDHLGQIYDKTGRTRLAATQWEIAVKGYHESNPADYEAGDLARAEKHLESAHLRLAKGESASVPSASSNKQ
jgi:tetratricopeptide (TPR) repeat protein